MRITYAILLAIIAANLTWSNIKDSVRWEESGEYKAAILKDLKFAELSEEAARHVDIQYTGQHIIFEFDGMTVLPPLEGG